MSDDYSDLPSADDDRTCPECGSTNIRKEVTELPSANRTANRLVGGQNRRVDTECGDCGWKS